MRYDKKKGTVSSYVNGELSSVLFSGVSKNLKLLPIVDAHSALEMKFCKGKYGKNKSKYSSSESEEEEKISGIPEFDTKKSVANHYVYDKSSKIISKPCKIYIKN
jgi:hypothetical protein